MSDSSTDSRQLKLLKTRKKENIGPAVRKLARARKAESVEVYADTDKYNIVSVRTLTAGAQTDGTVGN